MRIWNATPVFFGPEGSRSGDNCTLLVAVKEVEVVPKFYKYSIVGVGTGGSSPPKML